MIEVKKEREKRDRKDVYFSFRIPGLYISSKNKDENFAVIKIFFKDGRKHEYVDWIENIDVKQIEEIIIFRYRSTMFPEKNGEKWIINNISGVGINYLNKRKKVLLVPVIQQIIGEDIILDWKEKELYPFDD